MARQMTQHVQQHLHLVLMACCLFIIKVESLNQEGFVLLEFKRSLVDPHNNLQSWNPFDLTPCRWRGIACTDEFKVFSINLSGLNLSGNLSPFICKIPYLTLFNVSSNFIAGPIPSDLAYCHNLEVLDLCTNRFHGELPAQICKISTLRKLSLCENYIYGEIPEEIGNLTMLEELVIYSNNFTGMLPLSLGNLKWLRIIRAGRNFFSGSIRQRSANVRACRYWGWHRIG